MPYPPPPIVWGRLKGYEGAQKWKLFCNYWCNDWLILSDTKMSTNDDVGWPEAKPYRASTIVFAKFGETPYMLCNICGWKARYVNWLEKVTVVGL